MKGGGLAMAKVSKEMKAAIKKVRDEQPESPLTLRFREIAERDAQWWAKYQELCRTWGYQAKRFGDSVQFDRVANCDLAESTHIVSTTHLRDLYHNGARKMREAIVGALEEFINV